MAERAEVVVVGSLNADLVVRTERLPAPGETVLGHEAATMPGGKGLNQAVAAARQGARTALVGLVGPDPYGDLLLDVVTAEGIDATGVTRTATAGTGLAQITVAADGTNSIVVVPRANARLDPAAVRAAAPMIAGARVLLVQFEVPLDAVAAAVAIARDAGVLTIVNPAPARSAGPITGCDLLVPNETEAAALTGLDTSTPAGAAAAARALVAGGARRVVVTLGHRGAHVADAAGDRALAPCPIEAGGVDATAAGDAYCGALAAALAAGDDLDDALRRAAAAGALATTVPGAVPSLPTRAATDALLATWPR